MPKRRRKRDPHAKREAERYENPIPSREFIAGVLTERGVPMPFADLAEDMDLHTEDRREALRRRLIAMERDGQLIRNRKGGYGLLEKMDLVRGRVIAHRDGYGFLVPDEGGDDLYLHSKQMRSLFHGDRVVVRVSGIDQRGRREGALVEVLERNTRRVVGRYMEEGGIGFVASHNKRIHHDVAVPPDARCGAEAGQIVVAEIVEQPSKRSQPIGRIVEIVGQHMGPGMEIDIALRAHDLPEAWPDAVLEEAARFGNKVPKKATQGRVDLRDHPLVTIDGEDARDFDDAVYCERKPRGWKLFVAIADVSAYVELETALDVEARLRGNSVYFPERVIPMLPEVLSNGLCSLNPDVDRLCMVCEMYVSDAGRITRSRFFEAVMRSHARLTYDQVAAAVVERSRDVRKKLTALVPHLDELYKLYGAFRAGREQRGAIDFETTETRIVFGEDRKIDRIEPRERNDAHRIIEECMIAANVATARFLAKHRMPALYRIHDGPTAEKLENLQAFLKGVGLRFGGGKQPEAKHYASLLKRVQGRPDTHLIQTVMLRSLAQAVYSPENVGHFGLSLACYAHFTSPIRRYPDLLVHRAIRHVLRGGKASSFDYRPAAMAAHGEHCSMTERRADDATRDAVGWLKCEFMLDKVGEVFTGIISAVTSFGLFVELDTIYVEGLVHISALGTDYFHFDPSHHRLQGERTGKVYRLADRVMVQVVRVDLDDRKIDLELNDADTYAPRGSSGKSGKPGKPGKSARSAKRRGVHGRSRRR